MATSGYNEADTRAKLIDPALHARQWIELIKDEHRATHGEIHREQSAVRIEILNGKPLKRGRGRVDYLLRAYIGEHEQPLTLAFIEANTLSKQTVYGGLYEGAPDHFHIMLTNPPFGGKEGKEAQS